MTYREAFDTLGDRIADGLTSDSYLDELWAALLMAVAIGLPFALYFFGWTQ